MKYQAQAQYLGKQYHSRIHDTDHEAVQGVLTKLPRHSAINHNDVEIVMRHVYDSASHVSYVTTLSEYLDQIS